MTRWRFLAVATVGWMAANSSANVSFERLVRAGEDGNWLTYSGSYRSERFLPLDQINRENVDRLKVIWAYQMQPTSVEGAGLQETTPVDGIGVFQGLPPESRGTIPPSSPTINGENGPCVSERSAWIVGSMDTGAYA